MQCQCASAIDAEMADWVALGGGNSGCCGNKAHTYGFHCPGFKVGVQDYSRRHEKAVPHDMSWACAGDFSHRNDPRLRAMHAKLLARLVRGDSSLSMICEFIGAPWPGKGVYYWARWNGVSTLQVYTGAGHDHWSHIAWWRSRAHQRAHLWKPKSSPIIPVPVVPVADDTGTKPKPAPVKPAPRKPAAYPRYPGRLLAYQPNRYDADLKLWQKRMRVRGWQITADGYFGNQTRTVVRAFQKEKRLGVDEVIGPVTWRAAWLLTIT